MAFGIALQVTKSENFTSNQQPATSNQQPATSNQQPESPVMDNSLKIVIASALLVLFGLFLLWQGFTKSDYRVMPRWIYIFGGLGMLVLPLAYLILILFFVP